jgi:Zn finger protein HypA/HybF involved in hydrogenase expression
VVDISAIAGTVSALKGAIDISKAMIGLHDAQTVQAKIIELNSKILEAQTNAFAANEERATLVQRIGELEKEVAHLKAWETEKQRYQLTDIGDGTFAYAIKESMSGGEPPHYICATCYEQAKKSILNNTRLPGGGNLLTCHSCASKMIIRHDYQSPSYVISAEEKARLALEPCPICTAGRLKITASKPDDTFEFAGVQRRTLKCDRCNHTESRLHDPNK